MRCEADPIWGAFSETSPAPLRVALSRGTESPGQGQPTALSCASLTVESEAGEGAMPRATGRFAQILRARGCVNARMNILTIWGTSRPSHKGLATTTDVAIGIIHGQCA